MAISLSKTFAKFRYLCKVAKKDIGAPKMFKNYGAIKC